MTASRAGQCFWLWCRTLDLFAPGTGTRRIQERLQETSQDRDNALVRVDELARENGFLRRELWRLVGEHNHLLAQDETNAWIHESAFTSPPLLSSRDTEDTLSLPVVN